MSATTKMIPLHDYKTGAEIWVDANSIISAEALPASRDPEIKARAKVIVGNRDIMLVSETPGAIAAMGQWKYPCSNYPAVTNKLKEVVAHAKDALDRAEKGFGGLSDELLDSEYPGCGGETRRQILESCRTEYRAFEAAKGLVESL